jgi:hypothetical protein
MEDFTGVFTVYSWAGDIIKSVGCVFYVGLDMRSIKKLNVRMEGQFSIF